ncbi:alpha/beta hydrolase family protein [Nocardiopsis sp. Huas11]|uniref:alpha/beta hydrolase n=1 Tax=Nocardiopsis sp. Huas11 TaxID=2183912 RepID=UPI000EB42F93|nr:alpha/beta fold hydrolase [Nocardiopsis sp. Huas11]RKS10617.1 alpha/beta hydrolase family protein [Nocardiopsis sp. Huas11]
MSDAIDHPLSPPQDHRFWLTTSDGVGIDAVLRRGAEPRESVIVLANGFTGSYRNPYTRAIADVLLPIGDVMTFDFRGHHGSGGHSTVGNAEIHDLEAVVARVRELGYTSVATVGFSMGAAVALRHAAIFGGVDAVVSVSAPSRWYYRGTRRMRVLHLGIERTVGRFFLERFRKVRVTDRRWDPRPAEPREVAGKISPTPLLVVHGDADTYFPVSHANAIHEAAGEPSDLWIIPGMGHAERAVTPELSARLRDWVRERMGHRAE